VRTTFPAIGLAVLLGAIVGCPQEAPDPARDADFDVTGQNAGEVMELAVNPDDLAYPCDPESSWTGCPTLYSLETGQSEPLFR
jgi:hypothetical protein